MITRQEAVLELAALHSVATAAAQAAYDYAFQQNLTYVSPQIVYNDDDEMGPDYFETSDMWEESGYESGED